MERNGRDECFNFAKIMTIFCKICGYRLHSNEPPAKAQEDVLKQMSNHLAIHKTEAEALGALLVTSCQLLSTYLLMKKYVRIPDSEKELLDSFDQNEMLLVDLFALEPAESKPKN